MKLVDGSCEVLTPIDGVNILKTVESAARTCYKSEQLNNGDLEKTKRFIGGVIRSGHESVLEHVPISVKLVCSVGTYKDLSRHRHASFSIQSTRYCDYSKDRFGGELSFIKPVNIKEGTPEYREWLFAMRSVEESYHKMSALGMKPDQKRLVLPHSTAAEVVMTANLREWRHVLGLRASTKSHPEVTALMRELLFKLAKEIPIVFDDVVEKILNEQRPVANKAKVR